MRRVNWSLVFTLSLVIFNVGYLLFNVHDWTGNGPWGWAATGFWMGIILLETFSLGTRIADARNRRYVMMATEIIRLQKEALDTTVVVPTVSVLAGTDANEQGTLRLGPICPN